MEGKEGWPFRGGESQRELHWGRYPTLQARNVVMLSTCVHGTVLSVLSA